MFLIFQNKVLLLLLFLTIKYDKIVCKLRLFDTECYICTVDQTFMLLIKKKWAKSFLTIWSNQDEEKMLPVVEKLCSTLYFHPGFFLLSLAFSLPQM